MSAHRAPSLLCSDYRRSWLAEWLALGARGQRMIKAAAADLERCEAIDRTYNRPQDPDLAAALADLRASISR